MREGAAHEGRMGGTGQLDVIGVATAALDQRGIFTAAYDTTKHTR